ncbi:transient receptor potential cation channel subfamily M member-like 2 [Clytia hemisphaerica]|uniref:transient receptor potential cation channel subfamily M member-like 2 n=1 Tax=Clytia hemisphaerica TaxID=252671 RepID=UPI0034D4882B
MTKRRRCKGCTAKSKMPKFGKVYRKLSEDRSAKGMDETDFSDISKADLKPCNQRRSSVRWVKSTIKAYEEPGKTIETNSFGECHFLGATRKAKGKFIRIAHDTSMKNTFSLLTEHWMIDVPQLLISVTGGAKSFHMDPRLKQQFASGLVKVANTPGAWVITGGTNTGVMKHVGEALQGATKCLIGIATYGIVTNKDHLLESERNHFGGKFKYNVASSLVEQGAFLDHNHTHFLLVDNGTTGKFGVEIPFRSALEEYIVKEKVPSVLLVLEGGVGTIGTVLGSLKSGVPAVIIKDSGRAADLLGYGLNTFTEEKIDKICSNFDHQNKALREKIEQTFPEVNNPRKSAEEIEEGFKKAYENVALCLKERKLIRVFEMGGSSDLDEAILTALLDTTEPEKQLNLTLLWDRADVAENKILSQIGRRWTDDQLHYAMLMALAEDRVDFVRLFLSYGVSVPKVVDQKTLEFLYAYRSEQSTLRFDLRSTNASFTEVTNPLVKRFCQENDVDLRVITMDRILMFIDELTSNIRHGTPMLSSDVSVENDPYLHLFLWAVLNGQHQMALYLWEFGEEGLAKSLVAIEINEKLAAKAARISNLPDEVASDLNDYSAEFRTLSHDLLDKCYLDCERKTLKLITEQSEQFNKRTSINMAVSMMHLEFVSHSCVQALLNDVWTGYIKDSDITTRDFLLTMLFPPYLMTYNFRTENETKDMIQMAENEDSGPTTIQSITMGLTLASKTKDEEKENEQENIIEHPDSKGSSIQLVQLGGPQKSYQSTQDTSSPSYTNQDETLSAQRDKELSFCGKMYLFYAKTPAVKFYLNLVSYIAFLCIYAYVAIKEKVPGSTPSVTEYIVLAFVVSFTTEEIHQLVQTEYSTFRAKIEDYLSNYWNLVDIVAIITYFIGFALRWFSSTTNVGHLILALNAGIWILRLLHVFYMHRIMGPYVVMIYRMFIDMMYFLTILFVFMVAYGVCSTAILVPQKASWKMFIDVIFHPYYNIYGELFIDRDPEDSQTTRFGTDVINSYAEPISWVMLALYLLIANVLLLNLLIAIFGYVHTIKLVVVRHPCLTAPV